MLVTECKVVLGEEQINKLYVPFGCSSHVWHWRQAAWDNGLLAGDIYGGPEVAYAV